MILSAAMMLRYDLGRGEEAGLVEAAVDAVVEKGYATADITREGSIPVGCREMGDKVKEELSRLMAEGGDGPSGSAAAVGVSGAAVAAAR